MEYTWRHGIQIVPNQTFKTDDPPEVGKILVDPCTGDKYKILSVAKPRDRMSFQCCKRGQQESAQTRKSRSYAKTVATL
jgi:hypothetical protein